MTQRQLEIMRYVINGLVATAVHFGVLTFNLEVLNFLEFGQKTGK